MSRTRSTRPESRRAAPPSWPRSVAALVLVPALLVGCSDDDAAAQRREDQMRRELTAEIEKTRRQADETAQALRGFREDAKALRDELGALASRIEELEARPVAAGTAAGAAPETAAPAKPKDRTAQLDEIKRLQEKVFSGKATEEEQRRFWELAREASVVDDLMKSLEAKVKENPESVDGRMQLAQAYIAKLLSIPGGPEQGIWSMKAEAQWQAVLKQDPNHWDAGYSLAFNWSMWPDFLNKTPDAVKAFEKLRDVQERLTPEAKHANTYFQLSRLYQKQGKADKAKETLRAGLEKFPEDDELRKAYDSLVE